jgi:hypothetical protein
VRASLRGHVYFDRLGELRAIKQMKMLGLRELLNEKYGFELMEADNWAHFLGTISI